MATFVRIASLCSLAALSVLVGVPGIGLSTARADVPAFQGDWTLASVTETFTVQQWSSPCGPAPVSRTIQPAGPATIRADGGEMVITGAARTYRSDQCLDPMTTLIREAHSSDGHTWRTRCATPPGDPRRAVVNSAYFLTDSNTLTIAETGRYEFVIEGARCVADVARQGSARRTTAPAAENAPAVAGPTRSVRTDTRSYAGDDLHPATATPAKADCSSPGEPARLEVRPSRKLLRAGEPFRFRAAVVDANGCPTPTTIRWSLGPVHAKNAGRPPFQPVLDGTGGLTVTPGDGTDASFDVIATAAEHSARASVEVTSATNYEALLAESGLGPNVERDEPAVAVLATTSLGAVNVPAEDGARHRRMLFIGIIGSLVGVLGLVALVGAYRSRRVRALELAAEKRHAERMRSYEDEKRAREAAHDAQMRAHLESVAYAQQVAAGSTRPVAGTAMGPMICPSCRREFSGGGGYCPHDANRLVSARSQDALVGAPVGGVCPLCRRGFNPGVRVCPHDGEELVPATLVAPPHAAPSRGKICPTCGARFEGISAFCSQDGTQLVLLN